MGQKVTFVYDGFCVMCSAFASFLSRHDRAGKIRLVASQSEEGLAAYARAGLRADDPETNLLVEADGRIRTHSDSSIRVFETLGFPWSVASVARSIPKALRDRAYAWIATNRYAWFGRRQSCQVVTGRDV